MSEPLLVTATAEPHGGFARKMNSPLPMAKLIRIDTVLASADDGN
jgi:hypothetical protein